MIKGLLKKDLYNLATYKASLIIIILFCGIAIIGTDAVTIAPTVICAIVGMISLSTFSYDEMSKSNRYIYFSNRSNSIRWNIRNVNNCDSCKYYELFKT